MDTDTFESPLTYDRLSTPHFDDERTVRAAQPVVPLKVVRTRVTRRRLVLAGALLLALCSGASAALLLVRFRQETQSPAIDGSSAAPQTKTVESGGGTASGNAPEQTATVTSGDNSVGLNAVSNDSSRAIPRADSKAPNRKASHLKIDVKPAKEATVQIDSGEKKDSILVDEWQEKRLRRVTPRERRNGNHRRGDLFNIRDIFEGPKPH